MIKKTITYTDYDGNERTEDFYFNLTQAEVVDIELNTVGGMERTLEKITQEQDTKRIAEMFKDIIIRSYGQKSLDGRRFIKSEALAEEFKQTEAYSQLFMELATNAEAATAFVNGIIPKVKEAPTTQAITPIK